MRASFVKSRSIHTWYVIFGEREERRKRALLSIIIRFVTWIGVGCVFCISFLYFSFFLFLLVVVDRQ